MSNNYVQQPPTSGKIILFTTHGELDIELWTRETPIACRNFIQLCIQGYYDNTIFHRMIPGFMIQGGDPTGSGFGGQSIYGQAFKDEFHQRLKFAHRGLVAMANSGRNTNKSQFFITFGQCLHLNKKHTIFGKVIGNTMFNLLSMQSIDTDESDRPIDPPRIKKTKIIINPFDDIRPRNNIIAQQQNTKVEKEKQQSKKKEQEQKIQKKEQNKKLKKKNLLSIEDQMQNNNQVTQKIKSSHDALDDKKLSKKVVITQQELQLKKKMRELQEKKKQELKAHVLATVNHQLHQQDQDMADKLKQEIRKKKNTEVKIQDDVNNYKTRINPTTGKPEFYWGQQSQQNEIEQEQQEQQQIQDQKLRQIRQQQKKQYQAIKADSLNFKKVQEGSLNKAQKVQIMHQKTLLSTVQRKRFEYLQKQQLEKHQGSMLEKLDIFKKRIHQKKQRKEQERQDWTIHKLKFHIDSANAFSQNQKKQQLRDFDDGGLVVQDNAPEYKLDKPRIGLQQLYKLTKQQ